MHIFVYYFGLYCLLSLASPLSHLTGCQSGVLDSTPCAHHVNIKATAIPYNAIKTLITIPSHNLQKSMISSSQIFFLILAGRPDPNGMVDEITTEAPG